MSATVGVAVATLLVVGGILAGPSLLECSRDSNGFGACLHDRMADGGLLAPEADSTEQPDTVADVSSEPSAPPAPAGWMEANANEYETPAAAPVGLTGSPATIAGAEAAPAAEPPLEVAIVPPAELATGLPSAGPEAATVTLDATAPGLVAEGAPSAALAPAADVALVGPQGAVNATGPQPAEPPDGAATLTPPESLVVEAPTAEPEVPPVQLEAEASVEPIEAPAPTAPEFNPLYPNVLVLPPPASGDNSSFRTLQLN